MTYRISVAFALLGLVYGFIIYILLTQGTITDTVEITSAIGIGIFGAIGSLVFYKVRTSNGHPGSRNSI